MDEAGGAGGMREIGSGTGHAWSEGGEDVSGFFTSRGGMVRLTSLR